MSDYDPWREVPEGWRVDWQVMPVRGRCDWGELRIVLHSRLTTVEQRGVLTHEIVHAERGPFPEWARGREERAVDAVAARRLIALDALADALLWSTRLEDVADQLGVDPCLVRARIDGLSSREVESLAARIDDAYP